MKSQAQLRQEESTDSFMQLMKHVGFFRGFPHFDMHFGRALMIEPMQEKHENDGSENINKIIILTF